MMIDLTDPAERARLRNNWNEWSFCAAKAALALIEQQQATIANLTATCSPLLSLVEIDCAEIETIVHRANVALGRARSTEQAARAAKETSDG